MTSRNVFVLCIVIQALLLFAFFKIYTGEVPRSAARMVHKEMPTKSTNAEQQARPANGNGETETLALRKKLDFLRTPTLFNTKPEDKCGCLRGKKINWRMVTFVKSQSAHFRQREAIRRTWASAWFVDGSLFQTIFVVGRPANGQTANLLDTEQHRYGDILQVDGPDDYKNVVLKTLAGMQWASENLHQDDYYSSSDDDMVVNTLGLKETIDRAKGNSSSKQWAEFPIVCVYNIMINAPPHREAGSKWLIQKSEYKWNHWPRSCFGGFYSTSVRVAGLLSSEARKTTLLRFDDVWVTGILRNKLGMPYYMVMKDRANDKIAVHLEPKSNQNALWSEFSAQIKTKDHCMC